MLMVKAEPLSTEENVRYAFKHGCCAVPAIFLSHKEGIVSFIACHSRHSDLHLSFKVYVFKTAKAEGDGFQHPRSDEDFLVFPSLEPEENLIVSMENNYHVHQYMLASSLQVYFENNIWD